MPDKNKHDKRKPYYVVYKKNQDGKMQYAGYAPMGCANVSANNSDLVITGTVQLSKFAVKIARNAGLIFGENYD